jgi:integrase
VATILDLKEYAKETKTKNSGITRKPGSNKLYVDFRYNGVRIVKSTGLDDTPTNYEKAQDWIDQQKEKIVNGTFIFAKAFPGASPKEKAFHAKFENWEYKVEPRDILFEDYAVDWKKRFLDNCPSLTKKRDFNQIITYWLIPQFGDKTFFQITGVTIKEFIQKLVLERRQKKGTTFIRLQNSEYSHPFSCNME